MRKKFRLFEIEDLPICPVFVRNALTEHLRAVGRLFKPYRKALPLVQSLLRRSNGDKVIDLCSGGGGPWCYLSQDLHAEFPSLKIILTDKYPNNASHLSAPDQPFCMHPHSVDATDVPSELSGARTLFTGYHHFDPESARKILQDAARNGTPIGIFEITGTAPIHFLMVCVVFLLSFVLIPFRRPFEAKRIAFTYLVPLIPLAILWDGLVSNLRSYSQAELRELGRLALASDTPYSWSAGCLRTAFGVPMTYLVGEPRLCAAT